MLENDTGIEFDRERRFWRLAGVLLEPEVAADSSCSVSERGPVSSSDAASAIPDEPRSKEIGDITP